MTLDLIEFQLVVAVVAALLSSAGLIWTWMTRRGQLNKKDIDEIEIRVTRLEERLNHAPSHDDLQLLHTRISGVGDEVGAVAVSVGELKGAVRAGNRLLDNIHQALLLERNP